MCGFLFIIVQLVVNWLLAWGRKTSRSCVYLCTIIWVQRSAQRLTLFSCYISFSFTGDGDSNVVVLGEDNFDDEVAAHSISLIEFYAPWCGHCKRLAPEYETAADTLVGTDIAMMKVDCTEHKDLCSKYGVRGFPTLKVFRNDGSEPTDYSAARTADAMVNFMKKQNEPAFAVFTDAAELESWAAERSGFYVVAHTTGDDSELYSTFTSLANSLRNDYSFAVLTGAESEKVEGTVAGSDSIVFDGEYTKDAMTAFFKAESFPLLGEIGPDNFQGYVDRGLPLVWLFIDTGADSVDEIKASATAAAASFKGELSFVFLDGNRWNDHAKNFGLSGELPALCIEDRTAGKNYIVDERELSEDKIAAFAASWKDGSAVAHVKSEDIPENNDGPVTILVGKNFDEIVMDDTKDVLVEFYAPWCGHCKSLAPKWEELGTEFANVDSVIIAKVDATANDTPAQIKGFPTLLFYPANNKSNPPKYSGERTVEAMAQYIRDNAAVEIVEAEASSEPDHDEL